MFRYVYITVCLCIYCLSAPVTPEQERGLLWPSWGYRDCRTEVKGQDVFLNTVLGRQQHFPSPPGVHAWHNPCEYDGFYSHNQVTLYYSTVNCIGWLDDVGKSSLFRKEDTETMRLIQKAWHREKAESMTVWPSGEIWEKSEDQTTKSYILLSQEIKGVCLTDLETETRWLLLRKCKGFAP